LSDDADASCDDADVACDDPDGDASHSAATAALAASVPAATASRHRPVRDGAASRPAAPDAAATPGRHIRFRLHWIGAGIIGRAGPHGERFGIGRSALGSLAPRWLEQHGEPPTAPERSAPVDRVRLPPRRARPRAGDLPRGALRRHRLADAARAPRSQSRPLHRQDRAAPPPPGTYRILLRKHGRTLLRKTLVVGDGLASCIVERELASLV